MARKMSVLIARDDQKGTDTKCCHFFVAFDRKRLLAITISECERITREGIWE
jgi:hypothetical protein